MTTTLAAPLDAADLAETLQPALLQVSRRLRQEAQKAGLSAQESMLLGRIKRHPGIGVSELADAEQVSRPSISLQIKRLEGAGWIARQDVEGDKRRSGFTITPAGRRQLEAVKGLRKDWLAARLALLTEAERVILNAATAPLRKLITADA